MPLQSKCTSQQGSSKSVVFNVSSTISFCTFLNIRAHNKINIGNSVASSEVTISFSYHFSC